MRSQELTCVLVCNEIIFSSDVLWDKKPIEKWDLTSTHLHGGIADAIWIGDPSVRLAVRNGHVKCAIVLP